jgi:saccharopine dehydrogenase (NAD+, L-lysine-forming)
MEQFDPDPFMTEIGDWGLPWVETFPQAHNFTEPVA